jgi:pilin/secretion family protein with methylation motif
MIGMRRSHATGRRSGFTLVELVLSFSVASVVFSSLYVVLLGLHSYFDSSNVAAALEEDGRRILRTMITELRQTGIVEGGAVNYPAIYERPVEAWDDSNVRGNLVATLSLRDSDLGGQVYDPNAGSRADLYRNRESTELAFKHLAVRELHDANNNPYYAPRLDAATGDILWSDVEYSYFVTIDPTGIPQLERRIDGQNPRVIGRYVRKVVFEAISHDPTISYNQLVIVLYMARRVAGRLVTVDVEGTVNLRNTKQID